MDNTEAEEKFDLEMLWQKLNELDETVQTKIAPMQDYANFILQKAYFKCGNECFGRNKSLEEVNNCINICLDCLVNAEKTLENEMAMFEEKMKMSMMACLHKYGEAKLQQKAGAAFDLASCVDQSIQENIKLMPHLNKLKAAIGSSYNSSS